MFRRIMDYLRYFQTWVWVWGVVSTSSIVVVIWALLTRLPGVVIFVLVLGTAVLMLVGLETTLIVYRKIRELLGARYERAVAGLDDLRTVGVMLRNRTVASNADLAIFKGDLAAFESRALAAMQGAARRTDIAWFRDLHEWTVTHGVSAYNDEHALLKATLDEKLRRMHEIAA